MDERITVLSPEEYVKRWAQWELGDPTWGRQFYNLVHQADTALTK